ncbi:undecaprenyl-diphosphate phosphatase [Pelolinea submarina]|uniref:Undecaprenyl-diphosphatase n=1 Tax=Pelolinea submarina TaxID=913107 RepID=A0A347ZT66_9CHLR|nr:undecaprenyl-diphosphate phosphatase [Pelolinea submarina]REG10928.1 undecaprenyl-diphosphatase [Pelolinea submarina]BBB48497.1 undecaprenyl-diphosphatase [Pelolinea submarina]
MNIVEILKVVLLGVVEGVTEWLPISSTGHMLLVDEFISLDMSEAFKEMFFVVIQFGAILAALIIFWRKLNPIQRRGSLGLNKSAIMICLKVAVACIPTGILGFLLDDYLEEHFGTPLTIAIMLIVYGIAFILVEDWNKKRSPSVDTVTDIHYGMAFLLGTFQSLAMIPGTSRSGATILGALLLGISREAAVEFSFFLVIPTMLGASLYKLAKFGLAFSNAEVIALAVGMAVAFIVSLVVIRLLIKYVRYHDFKVFGWYRILLGSIILALFAL